MTSDQISAVAGILLSLIFSYVPGIKDWFDLKPPAFKQMLMGVLLVVVAVGAFGPSCAGVIGGIECNSDGAIGLLWTLITALMANQAAYLITRRKAIVVAEKPVAIR